MGFFEKLIAGGKKGNAPAVESSPEQQERANTIHSLRNTWTPSMVDEVMGFLRNDPSAASVESPADLSGFIGEVIAQVVDAGEKDKISNAKDPEQRAFLAQKTIEALKGDAGTSESEPSKNLTDYAYRMIVGAMVGHDLPAEANSKAKLDDFAREIAGELQLRGIATPEAITPEVREEVFGRIRGRYGIES